MTASLNYFNCAAIKQQLYNLKLYYLSCENLTETIGLSSAKKKHITLVLINMSQIFIIIWLIKPICFRLSLADNIINIIITQFTQSHVMEKVHCCNLI